MKFTESPSNKNVGVRLNCIPLTVFQGMEYLIMFTVIMVLVSAVKNSQAFRKSGDLHTSPVVLPSNGLVERTVQTVKNIIRKSLESGEAQYLGLLAYRTTLDNQKSPAEFLMGRSLRSNLPVTEKQLEVEGSEDVIKWRTEKKKLQMFYHDQHARPMKPLKRLFDYKKQVWGKKRSC